jgi:hypothetical protein
MVDPEAAQLGRDQVTPLSLEFGEALPKAATGGVDA